jgi:hypothetical protein
MFIYEMHEDNTVLFVHIYHVRKHATNFSKIFMLGFTLKVIEPF